MSSVLSRVQEQPGGTTIATGQVTVTDSATQIAAARSGRRGLVIVNHGTTDVYVGLSGVTTATGVLLKGTAGASISIPTSAAVYGIVAAAGSQGVSYLEVYD